MARRFESPQTILQSVFVLCGLFGVDERNVAMIYSVEMEYYKSGFEIIIIKRMITFAPLSNNI